MVQKTKYIQDMLKMLDTGAEHVENYEGTVSIKRGCTFMCNKLVQCITVYHYGTLILEIIYCDAYQHVGKNGRSFNIGEFAYSITDARIINQVLEKYVPGFVAHSRKGEVIVD